MHAQKKAQQRRQKLEEKSKREEELVEAWFAQHDQSKDGKFDKDEARNLLNAVGEEFGQDNPIKDDRLEQIMKKYAGVDGELDRTEVLVAVKRYKAILKADAKLKEQFIKHDADGDGNLQTEELLTLLKELAAGIGTVASMGDAEFVMSRADLDGTGDLSLDELEYAIAVWQEHAKNLPPEPEKSSACVLL